MRRVLPTLAVAAVIATQGCGRQPDELRMSAPAPPPAAVIAPVPGPSSLSQKLARLDRELELALAGEFDERAAARIFRAEAITDALLETDPPFAWLESDYRLEARLRQLQALSDRVVAQMRRGVRSDLVLLDVHLLREHVTALRTALREENGGPAPPPLDTLLAGARSDEAEASTRD